MTSGRTNPPARYAEDPQPRQQFPVRFSPIGPLSSTAKPAVFHISAASNHRKIKCTDLPRYLSSTRPKRPVLNPRFSRVRPPRDVEYTHGPWILNEERCSACVANVACESRASVPRHPMPEQYHIVGLPPPDSVVRYQERLQL
jgi:hypothetical protein